MGVVVVVGCLGEGPFGGTKRRMLDVKRLEYAERPVFSHDRFLFRVGCFELKEGCETLKHQNNFLNALKTKVHFEKRRNTFE